MSNQTHVKLTLDLIIDHNFDVEEFKRKFNTLNIIDVLTSIVLSDGNTYKSDFCEVSNLEYLNFEIEEEKEKPLIQKDSDLIGETVTRTLLLQ